MKTLENRIVENPAETRNYGRRKTTGEILLNIFDMLFVPTSLIRHYLKAKKNQQPPREKDEYWRIISMCDPFGAFDRLKKAAIWSLITYFEMTRAAVYYGSIVSMFSSSQQ